MMPGDPRPPDPENYEWRVGRKVGRTIYAVTPGDEPDPLVGVMDTVALAAEAVRAHNADLNIRASR